MNRLLNLVLSFVLLLGSFSGGCTARAEGAEDYLGIWAADGVTVEIRREDDAEEGLECRIVFMEDGSDDSDVWIYNNCWYDGEENCLQCMNVVREHQHYDDIWQVLEASDWSLNDMDFARFDRTEDGLRFSVDVLDAPIDLVRPDEAETWTRGAALAFLGRWRGDDATLRVEDLGPVYLFTAWVPLGNGATGKWSYTCRYDATEGRMVSVSVSPRSVITPTEEGGTIEEEVGWDNSKAFFTLTGDGQLLWSDVTDGDGEDMTLERAED